MSNTFSGFGLRFYNPELYSAYKSSLNKLLPADPGDYPNTDREGNPWANIGIITVKDFFSKSKNVLSQDRIMRKYCIGSPLLLVPNPVSKNEVHIITTQGKQLGLLPDDGGFTDMVKRRLKKDYDVFAHVYNYGLKHDGRLFCEIRIIYYVTPFDKGVYSLT